jgi:hypothetical protein
MQVAKKSHGRRRVTHKFGEGVNPKLRLVASAMSVMSLDGRLLKYSSRRLVYGVDLATKARDYLLGIAEAPQQFWAGVPAPAADARITSEWLSRWAMKRIQRDETVRALEQFERMSISQSLHVETRPERSLDLFPA